MTALDFYLEDCNDAKTKCNGFLKLKFEKFNILGRQRLFYTSIAQNSTPETTRSKQLIPLLCNLSLSSNLNLKIAIIVRCIEQVLTENLNTNTLSNLFLRLFLFFGPLKPVLPFFFPHNYPSTVLVIFGQRTEKECEGEKWERNSKP